MADDRPFSVRCEQRDGGVVVVAEGEIDLSTSPAVREQLRAPDAQAPVVVLDLRDVTFMDSSGHGAIVGQHKRAREHGFRFALAIGGAAARWMCTVAPVAATSRPWPETWSAWLWVSKTCSMLTPM